MRPSSCECYETGADCCGLAADGPVVEWMPEWLRDSHDAAGTAGMWPHNGAVRLRMSAACADALIEYDGEWASIVS